LERRLKPCNQELSPARIRDTVIQVFEIVESTHIGPRAEQVQDRLHALLAHGVRPRQSSGLHDARQTFLILACLARATQSEPLADDITGFVCKNIHLIVDREKPYRCGDWIFALQEMRGLEDNWTLDELIARFSHSNRTT
ncbi:hypothetical protein DE146DRAFT_595184, partial [Phaeosphaeria sp. MPI-PUGE-AT-0046c]